MEAKANFVSRSSHAATPWILDTGASHHVTSSSKNLQNPQGYNGPEEITMGDGNSIPITQTGFSHLYASNHKFCLPNTLCAPAIQRNLIFVSQFCKDNLTSIEFFPYKFVVKDLSTGALLACGQSRDDLYEWPSGSFTCQANLLPKNPSLHLWHRRLGHPNQRVLQFILNKFSLSYSNSEQFFCNSCSCNKSHKVPFLKNTLHNNYPLQTIVSDL